MKNELLKNIICSKEEEIREKEKELKELKDNFENAKPDDFFNEWTKVFTEAYIKYKQYDIDTLKERCNRYKKKYNLEEIEDEIK
jgi:hypothetical protein